MTLYADLLKELEKMEVDSMLIWEPGDTELTAFKAARSIQQLHRATDWRGIGFRSVIYKNKLYVIRVR
jgi:hypothetical protein